MRKIVIALAALAAVGFALPVAAPANAETVKKVIIKRGGHHHDGRHHRAWNRHGHVKKVVVIKKHTRRY